MNLVQIYYMHTSTYYVVHKSTSEYIKPLVAGAPGAGEGSGVTGARGRGSKARSLGRGCCLSTAASSASRTLRQRRRSLHYF